MGMQPQTYSLNGLAVELSVDRRTLAKKLERVRPAEERDVAGRKERRWRMADAVAALERHASHGRATADEEADADELVTLFQTLVAENLVPAIVDSQRFRGVLCGYAVLELGLTKPQALDLLGVASYGLLGAICEAFRNESIDFPVEGASFWEWGAAKRAGTTTEFLSKNWPDSAPAGSGM